MSSWSTIASPALQQPCSPLSLSVLVNGVMRASLAGRLCHDIPFRVLVHRALLVGESWLTAGASGHVSPAGCEPSRLEPGRRPWCLSLKALMNPSLVTHLHVAKVHVCA